MVASAFAAGSQDILEVIGRVPHVRPSVRGPKKMGEALRSLWPNRPTQATGECDDTHNIRVDRGLLVFDGFAGGSSESDCRAAHIFFRPRSWANVGHRPIPSKMSCDPAAKALATI